MLLPQRTVHLSARLAETALCGKVCPTTDPHGRRHTVVVVHARDYAEQYYADLNITWCDACLLLSLQ